jgi:tripartite-type tricarboxylate transporter receptor subunit TctC
LPDVPTTAEAGLPNFQVSAWNAMFAPKGTPAAVVARLSQALTAAVNDPAARKRLVDLGADVPDTAGASPAALAALVKRENERWIPLLKNAGVIAQ